ncbi:MAG: XRE family transcriptional regulator [Gemmatimonadota bacterium]
MDLRTTLAHRLRNARERSMITQQQVADRLGVARSAVSEMETGKREVSAVEAAAMAGLYAEPLARLLAPSGAAVESLMLRSAVSAGDAAGLRRFLERCQTYRELEERLGEARFPELRPVAGILELPEEAHALADEERRRLDLGATPGRHFLNVLEEDVGIKIVGLELGDDLSGASIQSPEFGPAILVNRRHSPGRQVFTLAHEYFHLLTSDRVRGSAGPRPVHIHEARQPDEPRDPADDLADHFAGSLLMPAEPFLHAVRRLRDPDGQVNTLDLVGVARYFGVSVQAVFVRLSVLGHVTREAARAAYGDSALQDEILRVGGEWIRTASRFRRLAVKAHVAGHSTRERLAELLDVATERVDDEVRRYGGGEGRLRVG